LNLLNGAAVLLAEPDPHYEAITRQAFQRSRLACELTVARDGEQALRLLSEAQPPFSLVLLALDLPVISGLDVLAAIRADRRLRDTAVIALSASNRAEDMLSSLELGANMYIEKPRVFEECLRTLVDLGRYVTTSSYLSARIKGPGC
jgi:two-component system response regulator